MAFLPRPPIERTVAVTVRAAGGGCPIKALLRCLDPSVDHRYISVTIDGNTWANDAARTHLYNPDRSRVLMRAYAYQRRYNRLTELETHSAGVLSTSIYWKLTGSYIATFKATTFESRSRVGSLEIETNRTLPESKCLKIVGMSTTPHYEPLQHRNKQITGSSVFMYLLCATRAKACRLHPDIVRVILYPAVRDLNLFSGHTVTVGVAPSLSQADPNELIIKQLKKLLDVWKRLTPKMADLCNYDEQERKPQLVRRLLKAHYFGNRCPAKSYASIYIDTIARSQPWSVVQVARAPAVYHHPCA